MCMPMDRSFSHRRAKRACSTLAFQAEPKSRMAFSTLLKRQLRAIEPLRLRALKRTAKCLASRREREIAEHSRSLEHGGTPLGEISSGILQQRPIIQDAVRFSSPAARSPAVVRVDSRKSVQAKPIHHISASRMMKSRILRDRRMCSIILDA